MQYEENKGPFSLLPLWEKVARTKSVPDEGSVSADRDPSSAFAFREGTFSHKGRRKSDRFLE